MKVIPGNAQDIGARESQQDAFAFSSFGDRAFEQHGGVLMILCDGMGGLANGAAASRTAVDAVLEGYRRKTPSEAIPDALNRVILEAHQAVCGVSGEGGAAGTTIVMAVIWRDQLYWGSLGDSRLYLCRGDGPAQQLTQDHNVATLMESRVRRGESSRREAAVAQDREALTAYLGAPHPPPPCAGRDGMMLQPGDRIVACSDGLYRGLSPDAICAISRSADPMTAAERMVHAVRQQALPYQDNMTVALLEVSADRQLPIRLDPAVLGKVARPLGSFAAGVLATAAFFLFVLPQFSGPGPQGPRSADGAQSLSAGAASSAETSLARLPEDAGGPDRRLSPATTPSAEANATGPKGCPGAESQEPHKAPVTAGPPATQASSGRDRKDGGSHDRREANHPQGQKPEDASSTSTAPAPSPQPPGASKSEGGGSR